MRVISEKRALYLLTLTQKMKRNMQGFQMEFTSRRTSELNNIVGRDSFRSETIHRKCTDGTFFKLGHLIIRRTYLNGRNKIYMYTFDQTHSQTPHSFVNFNAAPTNGWVCRAAEEQLVMSFCHFDVLQCTITADRSSRLISFKFW